MLFSTTTRPTFVFEGHTVNEPTALHRVRRGMLPPRTCRFCGGSIQLVSNREIYGRTFGWPLTYACECCDARVGCHPGTDVPLGTLANDAIRTARAAAHAAFDQIWKRSTAPKARRRAYSALARALGQSTEHTHISWMDERECEAVIAACKAGAVEL